MVISTITDEAKIIFENNTLNISNDLKRYLDDENRNEIFISSYDGLILLNHMSFYDENFIPEWYIYNNIYKKIAENIEAELILDNQLKYNNIIIKLEFIIEYNRRDIEFYVYGNII